MKPNRELRRKEVSAEVISLAEDREACRGRKAETAPVRAASLAEAYRRWLALAGALWAFWWWWKKNEA